MLLITFAEALWTVVGILGPLFILALYPVFERTKLLSPFLVVPGMLALTAFLYFFWGPHLQYSHFLTGSAVFFALYLPSVFRWRYRSTDGFVLSALAVLAADQLWQIPVYIEDWGKAGGALWAAGAMFSMMSLPLFFYFLGRGGSLRFGGEAAWGMLSLSAGLTISLSSVYWVPTLDYSAFFMWAATFGLMVRASGPRPLPSVKQSLPATQQL